MKKQRTYTHWPMTGDLPANIGSNYTQYRRVDSALGFAGALGFSFLAASTWALWRDLPGLGPLPQPAHLPDYLKAWACLIPHALGARALCQETAAAYLRWAGSVPWLVAWARPALVATFTGFGACAGFALGFAARSLEKVIEGAEVKEAPSDLEKAQARILGGKKAWMPLHPGLSLPRGEWGRHLLIYGSTGAGKTTIQWPIVKRAFRKKYGAKSFIFDPKGDFTKGTSGKNSLLFCPWDERSAVWDIARDVTTQDQARSFAAAFTAGEKQPYFQKVAADILTGVFVGLMKSHGLTWGWGEFLALVSLSTPELYAMLKDVYPEGAYTLENPTDKQASTNRAAFSAGISPLLVMGNAWGDGKEREKVSMREWVADDWKGPKHLIFQGNEGAVDCFYIGAMLDQAARAMINPAFPDSDRTIFFILDELPALGKVDGLPSLLDKGRSKGAVCVLGYQDLSQLSDRYGKDAAKGFSSMVGTHVICQTNPGETRDFIAKSLGRQRVEKVTQSHNTKDSTGLNASYGIEERDTVLSSDLTETLGPCQLDRPEPGKAAWGIIALVSTGGQLMRLTFPGFVAKNKRPQRIPAAWTLNDAQRQDRYEVVSSHDFL